jgi:hypothetical protein
MSLAAVPAYLIARRVLSGRNAGIVAVLTVAVPSMFYTGTIMTENAFYPAFLVAVYAIVLALERPSAARQLWVLALVGVAFLVRVQAVALVATLVTAAVLVAAGDARGRAGFLRRLAAFRIWWVAVGGGAVLLVLVQLARGRPVTEILGAYRAAGDSDYSAGEVAKWFLYHVAELDLYLGVVPFAAFLFVFVLGLRRSEESPAVRALAATAIPAFLWLALLVATFASQPSVARIQERNLFYVAPLFFTALLVWIERGLPRPRVPTAVAVAVAAGLPATLPYFDLINVSIVSDTLALLPWWNLQDSVIDGHDVRLVASLCAVAAGALVLLIPRRWLLALPALVLVYFAIVSEPISGRIEDASVGALFAGIRTEREWIDEALPDGVEAVAIWNGAPNRYAIWENEFMNRSVGSVYYAANPLPGNLPETPVTVADDGALLVDGDPLAAEYALSDGTFPLDGEVVARDPGTGMTVVRAGGPLRLAARIQGIDPSDNWSGPEVTYTRLGCRGGSLRVTLTSDPLLFSEPQTVVARVGGREAARAVVRPTDVDVPLRVPLVARDGRCEVAFAVSPTAVPAEVLGTEDARELGIHFTSFAYSP